MDLKAYWKEIAGKAGLSADEVSQMESMLGNEKVAKAFEQGFKPLPDYSRDLDSVRDKTRKEAEEKHNAKVAELEGWYTKEHDKHVNAFTKLQQYQSLYGELEGERRLADDRTRGDVMTKAEFNAALKEQVDQIMAQQRQREASYLDYFDISRDYERTFKKPFDQAAFQKFMSERQDLQGAGMKLAYKEFVGPDAERAREAEWQAKMDAKYQEGIRDGASRKVTPSGHTPKTFSPLLDQKTDVKKMGDFEQEQHSRESFLAALNNPDEVEKTPA